jgi:hypothetical protein
MARYQVIIAYDGTRYMGYQRQHACTGSQPDRVGNAVRTVQGEIEAALRQVGWDGQSILSAGRTDTGVHAAGQVIAFDLEWHHTPQELCSSSGRYRRSARRAGKTRLSPSFRCCCPPLPLYPLLPGRTRSIARALLLAGVASGSDA